MPSIVVLGARNLGGAILGHHLNNGWRGAAVARSPETLETVRAAGGLPLQADASDPEQLRGALEQARAEFGRLDVIVNAGQRRAPDQGRPVRRRQPREAERRGLPRLDRRGRRAGLRLPERGRARRGAHADPGHGRQARRAMPGRGLWAAGAAATRALVHAAAQELRAEGVHVALLIVDATIDSPKTAAMIGRQARRTRPPTRPRSPAPSSTSPARASARTRTSSSSPPRATAGSPKRTRRCRSARPAPR